MIFFLKLLTVLMSPDRMKHMFTVVKKSRKMIPKLEIYIPTNKRILLERRHLNIKEYF